jgi:hypothetical protein
MLFAGQDSLPHPAVSLQCTAPTLQVGLPSLKHVLLDLSAGWQAASYSDAMHACLHTLDQWARVFAQTVGTDARAAARETSVKSAQWLMLSILPVASAADEPEALRDSWRRICLFQWYVV